MMRVLWLFSLTVCCVVRGGPVPIPGFSWDTVPVFCFPAPARGEFFATGDMREFAQFNQMNFWGVNITALPGGHYAETQEAMSNAQAARLKGVRKDLPLFSYLITGMSQTWFHSYGEFLQHPEWFLRGADGKVIMDYTATQGAGGPAYNFSAPGMVQFWLEKVLGPYVEDANLQGIFFDETDQALTPHTMEHSAYEANKEATIEAVVLATQRMTEKGKLPIWSMTCLPKDAGVVDRCSGYERIIQAILKYGGFRYYEFYLGFEMELEKNVLSDWDVYITAAQEEAMRGVPLQVHARNYISNPRTPNNTRVLELKLAGFLLAMGTNSFFAVSQGWMYNSFPFLDFFSKPLGEPRGPAVRSVRNLTTPAGEWMVAPSANNVAGLANLRANSSAVTYLGDYNTPTDCQVAAVASGFTTFTYATSGSWARGCYARVDNKWSPARGSPGTVSGCTLCTDMVLSWKRDFAHASVVLSQGPTDAVIQGGITWHQ